VGFFELWAGAENGSVEIPDWLFVLNVIVNNMKKILLFFFVTLELAVQAQTNSFPSTGNVGIGTTSPASILDVIGNITMSGNAATRTIWNSGYGGGLQLLRSDANSTRWAKLGIVDGSGNWVGGIHVSNDTYVGIGTTTPGSQLDVNGNITMSANATTRTIWNGGYGGAVQFLRSDATSTRWARLGIVDGSGNWVNGIHVSNDANVGIGTTAPSQLLQIRGEGSTTFLNVYNDKGSSGGTAGVQLGLNDGGFLTQDASRIEARIISNPNSALDFKVYGTTVSGTGISPVMSLLGTGKVGIGTTNPAQMLQVISGDDHTWMSIRNNKGAPGSTSAIQLGLNDGAFVESDASRVEARVAAEAVAALDFKVYGGVLKTIMTLSGTGEVGIGTTSPTEKLSVNGNIIAKKIKITQAGWSDYVFNTDYKLRSLSSLESFIKQNKHLPEIPSAKEVEENGISVGDTQALLLKKIEELSLYVIALNKKIEEQNKRIQQLERIRQSVHPSQ
jgi:hypothetical protein